MFDLELREGSRFFLPSCSIRSLVTTTKSLKLNSLGGGGIWATTSLVSVEMFSVTKLSISVHT